MRTKVYQILTLVLFTGVFTSCLNDKSFDSRDYPKDIGDIMINKCATQGCHNTQSKDAASGLSLSTWEEMMQGSRNGAVTIPYTYTQSSLFLFTNTYQDLGVSVPPAMPFNQEPLSREEVLAIRYWISEGAPNKEGFVKYSDDPNRTKYYVVNRGCDLVAVMDAETDILMRYVKTTFNLDIEYAEEIHISPDGEYWYITSKAGQVIQKYRTDDDSYAGALVLDNGVWKSFCILPDSKRAFAVNSEQNGELVYLDLENMSILSKFSSLPDFAKPYSVCFDQANNYLFVGAEKGNYFHKIDITDPTNLAISQITVDQGQTLDSTALDMPTRIFIHPDGSKYYAACKGSASVKVFNMANDSMIANIPVGIGPETFTYSASKDYLFVACPEDTVSFPDKRGSVSVINCQDNAVLNIMYPGSQPHGMVVDEQNNRVIIANRNFSEDGPKPHHVTECEGRNGYITYIDLNTLELVSPQRYEVSVDPLFVVMRE